MGHKNVLMIAYTNYTTDPRVIREANAAVNAGYSVDFIALRRESEKSEIVDGVNVIRVNQSRYRGGNNIKYLVSYLEFFLRTFFVILRWFPTRRYDVVHVNNMPDFMVFSALLPKIFGKKIILDIHDPMPSTFATKFNGNKGSLRYKLLLWEERISAAFADQVTTVHEPIKRDILVKDGISEKKTAVVANFADDELFSFSDEYLIGDKITLLFHGTIAERFGLQNVLSAIAKVKDKNKIFFKIIGEGDFSEHLKSLIRDFALEDVVDFDNKFYPVKDLPCIIRKFNIGMVSYMPSMATDYMLPLKLLEYISCGLPVITLKNKAIEYYFSNNDLMFYEPNEISSLVCLLENIIENPGILRERKKNIKQIREKFLWSNEKLRYIELLKNLCEVKIGKN